MARLLGIESSTLTVVLLYLLLVSISFHTNFEITSKFKCTDNLNYWYINHVLCLCYVFVTYTRGLKTQYSYALFAFEET